MKLNTFKKIAGCTIVVTGMFSCQNGDEFFAVERYEKMIYIISEKDNNIFTAEYELTGGGESVKTLPFAISGSNPIDKNVHLSVEYDPEMLYNYNNSNFLDETEKYAHELDSKDFELAMEYVDIKVGADPNYEVGKLPIIIKENILERLSVDSTYFISLRIKEAEPYPVNEAKKNVLYRILKKNKYASQKKDTYYTSLGYIDDGYFSTSKKVMPLSYNSVRVYVGSEVFSNEDSEQMILNKAMKITVGADNKITISPYKEKSTVKVELLTPSDDPNDNSYAYRNEYKPEEMRFYLYYRYDIGQGWKIVRELLTSEEMKKEK